MAVIRHKLILKKRICKSSSLYCLLSVCCSCDGVARSSLRAKHPKIQNHNQYQNQNQYQCQYPESTTGPKVNICIYEGRVYCGSHQSIILLRHSGYTLLTFLFILPDNSLSLRAMSAACKPKVYNSGFNSLYLQWDSNFHTRSCLRRQTPD